MVRIGLVGTGEMAATHAAAYAALDDATVVAVRSRSRETAEAFVADHAPDATACTGEEEFFDRGVDAVDVCTPTSTHRAHVVDAVDRGIDVFCEKPLARTLADATAIQSRAADADASVTVGHVVRFFPEYAAIHDRVASGAVGTPGVARARRLSPFPDWGADDWYADREAAGGVLVDLAIHDLDFLRWTLGPVDRVHARTSGGRREHAHATLRFESGAVGYVEASWALPASQGLETHLEVAGDDGLLEHDSTAVAPVVVADADGTTTERPLRRDPYARELAAFVDGVRGGTDPPVSVDEAVASLRLSLAATASASLGEPVAPGEVGP
jgi:predicted dehydrogenase